MIKQEILKALLDAKLIYEEAFTYVVREEFKNSPEVSFVLWIREKHMESGFCFFFEWFSSIPPQVILNELEVDSEPTSFVARWWYTPAFYHHTIENKREFAFLPRLNNLNRTIARLQAELNSTNKINNEN